MKWKEQKKQKSPVRAVAYYRYAAQGRQEDPIHLQREQVRKFAAEQGIEIVREFQDAGKSDLTSD